MLSPHGNTEGERERERDHKGQDPLEQEIDPGKKSKRIEVGDTEKWTERAQERGTSKAAVKLTNIHFLSLERNCKLLHLITRPRDLERMR